jgi:tRNA threonylcarbamoyladenosine biosynthesis protein TsaB
VRLLAIETATDAVGVALLSPDGGTAERVHLGGRAHAELLAPAIAEVCAVSGCSVRELSVVAVDIGPGLFTGLRVGVATARGLAQALGIGVVGVTSLDVLGAAAHGSDGPEAREPVAAVVDARRGEVFAASYRFDRAAPTPAGGPVDPASVRDDRREPLAPDALAAWLADLAAEAGRVRVVGDGAVRYRTLLDENPRLDLRAAGDISVPPPDVLARLAFRRLSAGVAPAPPAEVLPDYRRPADARINWEQRVPRPSDPVGPGAR